MYKHLRVDDLLKDEDDEQEEETPIVPVRKRPSITVKKSDRQKTWVVTINED